MMNIGRVCVKTAGRDAGKKCVIVNVIDDNFVTIEGETRRRKCNIRHLEPLEATLDISQDASLEEVSKALGINPAIRQPKAEQDKPKRVRKAERAPAAPVVKAEKVKKTKPAKA